MPRSASPRKRQAARRPAPVPVKRAATSRPQAKTARVAKGATEKGNNAVRAEVKAPPRDGRVPDRRGSAEKGLHAGRGAAATESAAPASRGKYVYCIIESSEPLRFAPLGRDAQPSDVDPVHCEKLAAVVSD